MPKGIYKRSKKEIERLEKMCRKNGFKKGYFPSDKTRKKLGKIMKETGRKPPSRKGIKHLEKTIRKMRERKHTKETREKMSDAHKEEKAYNWKGDEVSYGALHFWIRRKLGRPKQCSKCGVMGRKNGKNWSIHWANKSGKYKRDLSDWIALCVKCHKKYDSKNYLAQ